MYKLGYQMLLPPDNHSQYTIPYLLATRAARTFSTIVGISILNPHNIQMKPMLKSAHLFSLLAEPASPTTLDTSERRYYHVQVHW